LSLTPIASSARRGQPLLQREIQLVAQSATLSAQIIAHLQTQEKPFKQLEIERQAQECTGRSEKVTD
jgi:hypothetical protein